MKLSPVVTKPLFASYKQIPVALISLGLLSLALPSSFAAVSCDPSSADGAFKALPDTGITSSQCYAAGSNSLVSCTSTAAKALNPDQDGMIGFDVSAPSNADGILGFSYSQIPKPGGSYYDKTECVKDNLTGLVWEGKTASGPRAATNTYTNLGYSNGGQQDSSQYVSYVNSISLCGFSDWRMPTVDELQTLDNNGISAPSSVRLDPEWFAKVSEHWAYWAAILPKDTSGGSYGISFNTAAMGIGRFWGSSAALLRLVRGANNLSPTLSGRFTYTTLAYGSDATNNIVFDNLTQIKWRRCSEGQVWNGTTCTGTATTFTHEAALTYAKNKTGWRLPNIKELSSIARRDVPYPGSGINETLFPAATTLQAWSSSPFTNNSMYAWTVGFGSTALHSAVPRSNTHSVRLMVK